MTLMRGGEVVDREEQTMKTASRGLAMSDAQISDLRVITSDIETT
jgi:hypothetical protein